MAGVLNGVKPGDQLAEIRSHAGFAPLLKIWVVETVSTTTCRAGYRSDRASFYLSTGKLISRTMSSRVVPYTSEVQTEFDEMLAEHRQRRARENLKMYMERRYVEAHDALRRKIVGAKTTEEVDAIFEAVKAIGKDG